MDVRWVNWNLKFCVIQLWCRFVTLVNLSFTIRPVGLNWVTSASCPRWGTHTLDSPCCTTSACCCCSSTHNPLTSTLTSLLLLKLARCVIRTVSEFKVDMRIKVDYYSFLQCDYSLVQTNLTQLEAMCKASWEQLKILDKAEERRKGGKGEKRRGGGDEVLANEGYLRHRLPKILKECEERLKVLRAVHRRVMNRCLFV